MHFDWQFFWKALFTPSDPFLDGLILTIVISVVAMILATLAGLVIALLALPLRRVALVCQRLHLGDSGDSAASATGADLHGAGRRWHLSVP